MTIARGSTATLAALLAAALACSGSSSDAQIARSEIAVQVEPRTVQVAPGGAVAFSATVTGTADTGVTWSVQEAAGGTIDASGRYVAPQAEGSYHVVARSVADPTAGAIATVTVAGPPPAVTVAVTPAVATVAAGGTVAFTASVTGTADARVTWAVREASGCGSITPAGLYTAPPGAATCHVVATSAAVPAATAAATVTVSAPPPPADVAVTVSPASAAVNACQSLTFTAAVSGTADGAVTWSVQEGDAGGTITPAGVYTAPPAAGTYHVVGTSHADPSRSQVATVTVTDRILSVQVSPANVSLAPGETAQFTATVTTTCGTFTSTSSVTAPN